MGLIYKVRKIEPLRWGERKEKKTEINWRRWGAEADKEEGIRRKEEDESEERPLAYDLGKLCFLLFVVVETGIFWVVLVNARSWLSFVGIVVISVQPVYASRRLYQIKNRADGDGFSEDHIAGASSTNGRDEREDIVDRGSG
ncbi:hypothetical protein MLD38_034504 [Melastoma candidum]|uniref:Uncharacterized protein n=1 Tax=Melastoma candidum TaxID=119954 RepID=A0ACB9MAM5_9MYRT|nr:hypothetical protein MLD38_034504 [Melastoma candidum]